MTRRCDIVRLAASTSFTAREVDLLDQILAATRRGGDVRMLAKSPEAGAIARKLQVMKASIERQRARRAEHAAELGQPDPNRSDAS